MNLSYGETEYDYRLFPCLRVTDLRKKPGGTLRPRWTGFTSMRVQGRMVSVSKWQVNCPNNSHSAFVIPTAIEISWVVGIRYSLDHSYDFGNSALTFKALSVPNFKPRQMVFFLFLCCIEFVSFSHDEVFWRYEDVSVLWQISNGSFWADKWL